MLKIVGKIMKEIAYPRVITVAQNRFPFKVFFIMTHFFFYIGKLGIKFVIFIFAGFP